MGYSRILWLVMSLEMKSAHFHYYPVPSNCIGEPTFADAILDRLVHAAHK